MAVEVIKWACAAIACAIAVVVVGLAAWGVFCALTGRIQ